MSSIVSELEILYRFIECEVNKTPTMKKKWSDIAAGRDVYETEKELTSIKNIQIVITSCTSPITNTDRRRNGTKPSKIITAPTSKYENNDGNQDGSHKVVIIIIGDSHTRGYASELSQNLNKQFRVTNYVKPNADVSILIDTAKKEVSKLTKNDILIFWEGANDVHKNASGKGLAQTVNFLRRNKHTNVIAINVPHRFDTNGKSCINEEVRRYNRKLSKIINKFENALLINAVSDRHWFINHGLHMNVKGKEIMTSKLMGVLPKMFDKRKVNKLIPWMWKNNSTSQIHYRKIRH
jgi:lysophospholipase L1-like esterase